jgi:hypothetical protein
VIGADCRNVVGTFFHSPELPFFQLPPITRLHTPIHGLVPTFPLKRFDIKEFIIASHFKKSEEITQIKVNESKIFLYLIPIYY